MIADFIDEYDGYLHLSDEAYKKVDPSIAKNARVFLEYGAQREMGILLATGFLRR